MAQFKLPDNWDSFETKEVLMHGKKMKIKYDPVTSTIYMLDEKGEWNGKKGVKKLPEESKEEEPIVTQKKAPKQSFLVPILLIVIGILTILLLTKDGSSPLQQTYSIIIVKEDIYPGVSVEGKLASIDVSANEYKRLKEDYGGIYLAGEYDNIKKYIAVEFIPKDGVVTHTSINNTFDITNPWTMDNSITTITIPVNATTEDIASFMWGNKVTITIYAERENNTAPYPNAEFPTADGVTSSAEIKSVQVDKHIIENVTIVDVLNASNTSLFKTFAGISSVPESYRINSITGRYNTYSEILTDKPQYIVLSVPPGAANLWGNLNNGLYDLSYQITYTGYDCKTELQINTKNNIQAMCAALIDRWEEIEEVTFNGR